MKVYREWAEEHWEAVGMMASMFCALTLATMLAVSFNVISTQLDRPHQESVAGSSAFNHPPQTSINRPDPGSVI